MEIISNTTIFILMRYYPTFRAIFTAFYSRTLYVDVRRNWKGRGFGYLAIIIAILLIPVSIKLDISIDSTLTPPASIEAGITVEEGVYIPEGLEALAAQTPEMSVKNGILTLDAEQPYIIIDPTTGEPVFVIDTTGEISSLKDTEAPILITDKMIFFNIKTHQNPNGIRPYAIREITEMMKIPPQKIIEINQYVAREWIVELIENSGIIPVFFYVWQFFTLFIFFGIKALIFAGIGFFICQILKTTMSFSTLMRLSAVATTPIIFFEALSLFFNANIFVNRDLVYFLMHIAYLYFAIESNVNQETL